MSHPHLILNGFMFLTALFTEETFVEQQLHGRYSAGSGRKWEVGMLREKKQNMVQVLMELMA